MSFPDRNSATHSSSFSRFLAFIFLIGVLALAGCNKVNKTPEPTENAKATPEKSPVPTAQPAWLGNPERNFYGTGPWPDSGQLQVIWEVKTGSISGQFHKDPWGGTSWPGQPSVEGDRVYFPSADGNTYCINRADGTVIWKFKARDSQKSTPTIVGDRIINGRQHDRWPGCESARNTRRPAACRSEHGTVRGLIYELTNRAPLVRDESPNQFRAQTPRRNVRDEAFRYEAEG
jgi:glucose dehydrogenase